MVSQAVHEDRGAFRPRRAASLRGFSLLEVIMVMVVGLILTAVAVPFLQSAMGTYRLRSAVSSITAAVQSARYQAIFQGYPFRVAFSSANNNYQVSSQPAGAPGFAALGGPIPFGSTQVTLAGDFTLQFNPSGSVVVVAGPNPMTTTVGYMGRQPKTIRVSTNGNVSVTP
ncbi:MAG TPA: GspH/FimT family pseudopilin [Candidatus Acidoferrales bacterium]|nr:GspH/FimT family pseudopilin [Candidatus Acidoferrales bacterium]